jgi:hypothetical protein
VTGAAFFRTGATAQVAAATAAADLGDKSPKRDERERGGPLSLFCWADTMGVAIVQPILRAAMLPA